MKKNFCSKNNEDDSLNLVRCVFFFYQNLIQFESRKILRILVN